MNCKYIFENKEYTFDELKALIKSKYKEEFKKNGFSEYSSYIARVSLGIIKNPSSGEYNYESKVRDIVYHGSKYGSLDIKTIKDYKPSVETNRVGIFFSKRIDLAEVYSKEIEKIKTKEEQELENEIIKSLDREGREWYFRSRGNMKKEKLPVFSTIINLSNPKQISLIEWDKIIRSQRYSKPIDGESLKKSLKSENYDSIEIPSFLDGFEKFKNKEEFLAFRDKKGFYNLPKTVQDKYFEEYREVDTNIADYYASQYAVFEPEQIHILSSKADIQGFKEFIKQSQLKVESNLKTPSNPLKEKYFTRGRNVVSSKELLQTIGNSNHNLSKLAKYLLRFNLDIPVALVDEITSNQIKDGLFALGMFNATDNYIQIAENGNFSRNSIEATILHEIIHALSYEFINNLGKDSHLLKEFNRLYNIALKHLKDKNLYPLSNLDEFITGVFTNSEFIKELSQIPSEYPTEYKNLMEEIFNWILSLFNVSKENRSLYEDAFAVATNILDAQYAYLESLNFPKDLLTPVGITEEEYNELSNLEKTQLLFQIKNC